MEPKTFFDLLFSLDVSVPFERGKLVPESDYGSPGYLSTVVCTYVPNFLPPEMIPGDWMIINKLIPDYTKLKEGVPLLDGDDIGVILIELCYPSHGVFRWERALKTHEAVYKEFEAKGLTLYRATAIR